KLFANAVDINFALLFEMVNARQHIAKREAALSDVPHLREAPKRIEQIQQRSVSSPKLAFEIIRRRRQQFRNSLRILMWSRRGNHESHLVFSAPAGTPGHLL